MPGILLFLVGHLCLLLTSRAWAASNGTAQTTSARASESWRTYSEVLLSGAISAELTAELLEAAEIGALDVLWDQRAMQHE